MAALVSFVFVGGLVACLIYLMHVLNKVEEIFMSNLSKLSGFYLV